MEADAGMGGEPAVVVRFMGVEIVENDLDLLTWVGCKHPVHEVEELLAPTATARAPCLPPSTCSPALSSINTPSAAPSHGPSSELEPMALDQREGRVEIEVAAVPRGHRGQRLGRWFGGKATEFAEQLL